MDFLAKFSKLVNGMGQALITSWTKLVKAGDVKNAQEALRALEAKVALMLQLLVHEDDDISTNVVGFCYDYLHILKQVGVPAKELYSLPGDGKLLHTIPHLPVPCVVECRRLHEVV